MRIKKRSKIFAIFIILILFAGWGISIFGVPNKVDNIGKQLKYGLDINGGVYVLLEANTNAKGTKLNKIMNQTKSVIENRVNSMGISEAQVSIEGDKRIRVEMPGVKDAEEAIKQIGRTAQLKFYLADGTPVLTGEDVKDSQMANDENNGGYKITIDFTSKGSELFTNATEKASSGMIDSKLKDEYGNTVLNNAIIISLDDEVISAPSVSEVINSSSCEITSPKGFTKEEASSLSALIRGGSLPVDLTEVNSSVQTATIGANALQLSVKAGIIGLCIVLILMIVIYGLLGLIADIALLLYVQLILWSMVGMGSVLTLPGIAGIILSLGMAVDSNIIIFTRIREEISKGKEVRVAVESGYKSALSTIFDSQTTTLIAALVLYMFGTTSVKGFAFTLMLGTIMSIITAVFITQIFVNILANSKKLNIKTAFNINKNNKPRFSPTFNIDFIKYRKIFYSISLCVILIGAGFGIFKGLNYGIDFTGGTMIQMEMGKEVKIKDVKESIAKYNLNPTVVYASDNNSQVIIRTIKDLKSADRDKVVKTLENDFGLSDSSVLASEEFGPTVGKDLRSNAIKAILLAALIMLIYIRFRFRDWRYGIASIMGLGHDILITLSIYAIFNITINNPFIAGILTVVGYSINDTIVIFDRIRENSRFFKKKENKELVNTSINQTLSRSIMTSLTTLIIIMPLFIMAGSELRSFLVPLIIGVSVGTYSSIFLCSPFFYEFIKNTDISKYMQKREQEKREKIKNQGIIK